jgi:hypothetical protein
MEEELEILESIYLGDGLDIRRSEGKANVSLKCCPRGEHQFVHVTLSLQLTSDYPTDPPLISIDDTFGVEELERNNLVDQLMTMVRDADGEAICFSLVEFVIETLDTLNEHACCHICLSPLIEDSPTVHNLPPALTQVQCLKTLCRHQYHSVCLLFWWREYVVSKHRAESMRGGEDVAVGREREAAARQKVLEQARQAASVELETSLSILSIVQKRHEEFNAVTQQNKKLTRNETSARDKEDSEINNELKAANERVETARSSLEKATDRLDKSLVTLESAHQQAAEASDQNEVKLVCEIPCPVCRTTLKLEDVPVDISRFMKNTRKVLAEDSSAKV